MKKCLILLSLIPVLSFTGCTANTINTAVKEVGQEVGIDIELNLEQEDLDKLEAEVRDAVGDVKDIVTDEDVQSAVGGLADALKDAVKESTESK